jgi:hypothetical protein
MPELKVGAGRRDITPYPNDFGPFDMRGSFSRRPATEVNDPLHARATYFENEPVTAGPGLPPISDA